MDGIGIAGLGWLIIALDGISIGVLVGLDPFTVVLDGVCVDTCTSLGLFVVVLDGVCRAGLVLMALALCWHVVHLTRWHFVVLACLCLQLTVLAPGQVFFV